MLDYKTMIRLRNMGLSFGAVAERIGCKWETVQRIVTRCENEWGAIDAVPNNLSNEEIAAPAAWDALFPVKSFRQSIRGRILKNATELEMKSPDLRLYKPEF